MGAILLVDDEKIVRKLMRFALASRGYEVLEARNGRQALSVAAKHGCPIDIMVCELFLPKMTGLELAEKLRTDHSELYSLFLSRTRGSREMEALAETAGYRVLREPFQMPELLAEIDRLFAAGQGRRKPPSSSRPAHRTAQQQASANGRTS